MTRLIEIRAYRLLPGSWVEFRRLFLEEAIPLLDAAATDVVAFGRSPDEPEAAFLIRAFDDLADRSASEDAFYGSAAWRHGPREAILACIDSYMDTVLTVDEATVDGLRQTGIELRA